jgi:hypothetical protein
LLADKVVEPSYIDSIFHEAIRRVLKKRNQALATQGGVIPPEQNCSVVANMEMVLYVYKRPFDPLYPGVCMDESPKQLIAETKVPIPASPGETAKHDYEYKRCGVCNVFLNISADKYMICTLMEND